MKVESSERYCILRRIRVEVNTDPLRRCYDGCHAKSELVWLNWEILDRTTGDKLEKRLKFWQELNDYAVSERGESAKIEFKVKLETAVEQYEN